MTQRILLVALFSALFAVTAHAEISDGVVKIGVLTDMEGPYAALAGPGSVLAARMAVEDFDAAKKGMKVEVVVGDHKNKVEVGKSILHQWFDVDKVDVVVDVPNSGVALAASEMIRGTNKALLVSASATSELTGKSCSPNVVHWTYDTWALGNGTGSVIARAFGKTWFFVTVDYAFGYSLQRDTETAVVKAGGQVLGTALHPLNAPDLSAYLSRAQASKAKVIAFANAGGDTINSIKLAADMGIAKGGQRLAAMLVTDAEIHSIGLEKSQGLLFTSPFYWDLNPKTRAWSKQFYAKHKQMPTMIQAGVYAAVLHYLKAADALRSDDGPKVVAKMKELPTSDPLFGNGRIRQDGRKIHPMYLFEVKKPSESRGEGDYMKLLGVVPAADAFRPEKDGGCPLVK